MDAFGAAHRKHASTYGIMSYAKESCAGLLLLKEMQALDNALANPVKPITAVIGGSKVSSKLGVLKSLTSICDQIIPGGGIANTFLAAMGYDIGCSLYEKKLYK